VELHDSQFRHESLCLGAKDAVGVAECDGRERNTPCWVVVGLDAGSRGCTNIAGPEVRDHKAGAHYSQKHHNHPQHSADKRKSRDYGVAKFETCGRQQTKSTYIHEETKSRLNFGKTL
jgi:hypothetical protein